MLEKKKRGEKNSFCSSEWFGKCIKGLPCYSENVGKYESIFKHDLWCNIFVSFFCRSLILLQIIKDFYPLLQKPLLVYMISLKIIPFSLPLWLFLSCKTRIAIWTRPVDIKGSKQYFCIHLRIQHFWAAVANCCFDCFQVQLLATLGQIKDKHAKTKPGN